MTRIRIRWYLAAILVSGMSAAHAAEPTPTPTVFPRCDFTPAPLSGPPGTTLHLSGVCYPIHSGQLGNFYFDDVLIGQSRGDTVGSYAVAYTVPPGTQPGPHRLQLRSSSPDAPPLAAATFEVLPSMCVGDCDGDGLVTIEELIVATQPALPSDVQPCWLAPPDGFGHRVDAVRADLGGCP